MKTPDWFTKPVTQKHDVTFPGLDAELAKVEAPRRDDHPGDEAFERAVEAAECELQAIRSAYTMTVELRPLDAGDMAELQEIRLRENGGAVAIGENKLLAVEKAIVGWSLPTAPTRDAIRQLNPIVFEKLWELVDVGEGPTVPASEPAKPERQPEARQEEPEPAASG